MKSSILTAILLPVITFFIVHSLILRTKFNSAFESRCKSEIVQNSFCISNPKNVNSMNIMPYRYILPDIQDRSNFFEFSTNFTREIGGK